MFTVFLCKDDLPNTSFKDSTRATIVVILRVIATVKVSMMYKGYGYCRGSRRLSIIVEFACNKSVFIVSHVVSLLN